MPDPTAGTPRTEAGRALLNTLVGLGVDNDEGEALHDILAIEAEASGTGLDAARQRVVDAARLIDPVPPRWRGVTKWLTENEPRLAELRDALVGLSPVPVPPETPG